MANSNEVKTVVKNGDKNIILSWGKAAMFVIVQLIMLGVFFGLWKGTTEAHIANVDIHPSYRENSEHLISRREYDKDVLSITKKLDRLQKSIDDVKKYLIEQ